ncbi:type II toxin-antitoxin system death-on-curing family toxin [Pseudolysinimonas sp.]
MTRYLELSDALLVVGRLGFHVRDAGLLASALARPATAVFGADAYATLELKAATVLESLARNHPLLDGNKRTAWTLTVLFLWINGFQHDMDTDTAFDLVLGVARGELEIEESAGLLRPHLVRR